MIVCGQRIRRLCSEAGIPPDEACRILRFLRGFRRGVPCPEDAVELADRLDVPLTALLCTCGSMANECEGWELGGLTGYGSTAWDREED